MSRRSNILLGAGIAALGLVLLLWLMFFRTGSVREHLDSTYGRGTRTGQSYSYRSAAAPASVAASIARSWRPAERLTRPAGHFLRYRNAIVAVVPDPSGRGSRIHYDPTGAGYHRWYPYVGGFWGTYSGPGDSIRGGGPGAGK